VAPAGSRGGIKGAACSPLPDRRGDRGVLLARAVRLARRAAGENVLGPRRLNNWEGTSTSSTRRRSSPSGGSTSSPTSNSGWPRSSRTRCGWRSSSRSARRSARGHDQLVDDAFTSPDGRRIYVSRPSLAHVLAISLRDGHIIWRTPVDGQRADHMAISPDGRHLLVSASTARKVDEIDTATGKIVGSFPSGDSPHESSSSQNGKADLPREHRARLHAARRAGARLDERRPLVRDRQHQDASRAAASRRREEAGGCRLPAHELGGAPDGDRAGRALLLLPALHGFVEYDRTRNVITRVARLPDRSG
jgi:hypothetical protein